MSQHRQALGKWGEQAAAHFLQDHGYQIVASNVRTPYGEIDLVASQVDQTVFVEVKTRATTLFGPPEVAITARKREHLLASAQFYVQQHPETHTWRVDVIAIRRFVESGEDIEITHFENVL
jgi:putative endonuclease